MKYLIADGMQVKVDDSDYTDLCVFEWHIKHRTKDHLYVYRYEKRPNGDPHKSRFKPVRLHRQIMGYPNLSVDHKNGDTLDNQRHNLRTATQAQQSRNTRRRNGKKYKGVTFAMIHGIYIPTKPWRARIRVNDRLIGLGYFRTQVEAARAYNTAAIQYFGEFACLNKISGETA